MRRFVSSVITVLLCLTLVWAPVVSASSGFVFSDVPVGHPAFDAVSDALAKGLVNSSGVFRPASQITRAEFLKILVLAKHSRAEIEGCLDGETEPLFRDVLPDQSTSRAQWFAPFVCIAKNNYGVKGFADGSFHPEWPIRFVEAAQMFLLFGFLSPTDTTDIVKTLPEGASGLWYFPAVARLDAARALVPSLTGFQKNITREEMIQMLYRVTNTDKKDSFVSLGFVDIMSPSGSLSVPSRVERIANVYRRDGDVHVGAYGSIHGDIRLVRGNLILDQGAVIRGSVRLLDGDIILGDNVTFTGPVEVQHGNIREGVLQGASQHIFEQALTLVNGSLQCTSTVSFQDTVFVSSWSVSVGQNSRAAKDFTLRGGVLSTGPQSRFDGAVRLSEPGSFGRGTQFITPAVVESSR